MKLSKKAEMQNKMIRAEAKLAQILEAFPDETLINLLIERRGQQIGSIEKEYESDYNYTKYETDSYRSAKADARSRLPYYKKNIKKNKDIIKDLNNLNKNLKKLDGY